MIHKYGIMVCLSIIVCELAPTRAGAIAALLLAFWFLIRMILVGA
jgi:CBS domain containing-hemolysin-like protein